MNEYAPQAAEARLLSADLTAPEDLRAAHLQRRLNDAEDSAIARALTRVAERWPSAAVFIGQTSRKDAA
ncbi:MAG: hypothetical protein ACYYKD_04350 [Rhodospirillales bacterium]